MYSNYRDYYLDYVNRQKAHAEQQALLQAQHLASEAGNRANEEWLKAPGFSGSRTNYPGFIQKATGQYQQLMGQHDLKMRQAMQNAMANEMAQVQDRMMDLPENQIAGKNRSDQLAYQRDMEKARLAHSASLANTNATKSIASGLNMNLNFGKNGMPDTNLYDNDGNRIGGSANNGASLFEKTGIKKSLMS